MIKLQKSAVVLEGSKGEALIRKTPGLCGGSACIRETRMMVWLLVNLRRQGASEEEILEGYPSLTSQDLAAAWEYERLHPQEIDQEIATQEQED